jgi:hypothetical protein
MPSMYHEYRLIISAPDDDIEAKVRIVCGTNSTHLDATDSNGHDVHVATYFHKFTKKASLSCKERS